MSGAKANALQAPRIMGVQTTTCLYNTAIPLLIGRRRAAGRVIWYGYFGPGNSGKKGKSAKKGITSYQANLDLLIGFGPIHNIQSVWNNSNIVGYGDDLSSFSQMGSQTFSITGASSASGSVSNVPGGYNLDFISAISFTPSSPATANIDDYGDPLSPRTITESVTEQFLYNTYFRVGHPGTYAWRPGSWALGQPFCNNASCTFPIGDDAEGAAWTATFPSNVTGTITVYWGATKDSHHTPLQFLNYEFEPRLGEGNEYNGSESAQQIIYPELSGAGGVGIDLGAAATAPELQLEAQGLYSLTANGQANPADALLDLILSGNIFFSNGDGSFTPLCFSHGLNFGGDPSRGDVFAGVATAGALPWPPAVTFPYVIPGNGLFQILKNPPAFKFATFVHGNDYPAGAIVLNGSTGLYYEALQYTGTVPGSDNTWRLFKGVFSDGLDDVRNYATANNIHMSTLQQSQRPCSEILNEICQIGNCVPIWNGQTLDFYPLSEVSAIGAGAVYAPRTASGPLLVLDYRYFIAGKGEAPVLVKQEGLQKVYNILDVNYSDQGSGGFGSCGYQGYQSNSVRICDAQHCRVYGPMNGSPLGFDEYIVDAKTATAVGWPIMKRQRFAEPYMVEFKLPASIATLLDPMELLTVVEPAIFGGKQLGGGTFSGRGSQDVRIKSLEEDSSGMWTIEAERFMYGMSAPNAPSVTGAIAHQPPSVSDPAGSVNTPYFFEPTAPLSVALGMSPLNGLCIAISGSSPNYGGCQVYVSTDGGVSYDTLLGTLQGNSVMGQVTGSTYPSHANPDNVDTLSVDLSESLGSLISFTSAQQNQLVPIALLDGGGTGSSGGYSLDIPYEIISYGTTALVSGHTYNCSPPILRGQLATVPAAHPWNPSTLVGSVFVDLSNPRSVFKATIPSGKILGNTLYFKFPTFNQFGSALQDLADCTPYTYAVSGTTNPGANSSYTVSPNPCLSQGNPALGSGNNDPTKVYFPSLSVNFDTGVVDYSAGSATAFSNPLGGETVYVSLVDPSHGGGSPSVDVQTTNVHATTPGYVYLGQITSAAWTGSPGSGTGGSAGGSNGGSSGAGGPQDNGSLVIEVNGAVAS